ncbi:uncharacterized protein C11orf97 homolog isoform X2 [Gallus gallus]|uniref:uncharacterized protein C11orf97 homolog isoform X2 n=1 Tax=Gallus gallus TaxID=9031 RepID=UPI000739C08B|nr:uncharacterized protein C11orf97 homolog isoform X2 [Gallus gallus]|eukprot:XP_015136018.1 uncharacterized protein C11orf97 homolog isoform X2 [Gallus gallus]
MSEKGSSPEGGRAQEQPPQSTGHGSELARVQQASGQRSQTYALIFGWSCVEPAVRLADPYGSLPTRDVLSFHGCSCLQHSPGQPQDGDVQPPPEHSPPEQNALAPSATAPLASYPPGAAAMRAANSQQPAGVAEEADSDGRSETAGGGQPRKNFLYVEPCKRVKEILEEELCFWKEECHIRHPAAVALKGIWNVKKNFSIGGLQPASQNRNGLLLQPQFYSRHVGMKKILASKKLAPAAHK